MFTVQKEIIYHLTCLACKGWFTYATMEEKFCIDRGNWFCPHCGHKGGVKKE
jgi:rRNA maturation endonuclease Nob1